jgi:hypothetical protein
MLAKRKTGVERMCNVSGLPEISCFTLIWLSFFLRKTLNECLVYDIYQGKQKLVQMMDNFTQNDL